MWEMDTIEWLDIELTSFCNIECKGCFRVISKHADKILNKEYIDIDTIRERFQKSMFPSIKIINFCGSVDEPTSHPQFFDIIKHFADWGAHINIATNGSLRTTKWWTELAGILPSSHAVTWGIDGSDELSEVYRQGSNFTKVEQNYRAFNAAGGRSNWQFIVFEHNEHQLEEAKQKASDEGFKNFKTIISHRKDTKGDVKAAKTEKIDNAVEIPYVSCKYGNQKRIFINHTGNVIPCCHLNSKMMEYNVTGIHKDEFETLLDENDYKNTINLENASIEDAINSRVWKGIIDSWDSDNPVPRCMQVCKQMKRDTFIKEEL
jgi:MoaA/NifB/PqqE/SkfB family radical SAM enzyme